MPNGKGVVRDCPFCSYSGRSDHLNRHVIKAHPYSAFHVAMPVGFCFVEQRPFIVVKKHAKAAQHAVSAFNRHMTSEQIVDIIHGSLTQHGQTYAYPYGFCYECSHLVEGDMKAENLTPFIKHVCKEKVERPWRQTGKTPQAVTVAIPTPVKTVVHTTFQGLEAFETQLRENPRIAKMLQDKEEEEKELLEDDYVPSPFSDTVLELLLRIPKLEGSARRDAKAWAEERTTLFGKAEALEMQLRELQAKNAKLEQSVVALRTSDSEHVLRYAELEAKYKALLQITPAPKVGGFEVAVQR